jgi:hypothetical protein
MKIAAITLVALSLAAAGSAVASSGVTDVDYIKASRCKGLATGLGSGDTAALDAFLKTEGRSRNDIIIQKAGEEMSKAKREASRTDAKDRLSAELNGSCMAYMSGGKDTPAAR